MDSPKGKMLAIRDSSLDEFEFLDAEDDLNVDLSKSPVNGAAEKLGAGISLIFSALSTAAEEEGMVVTIPVTAVAATAIGAVTGSLLAGPSGLALGLITGAVIAYRTSPRRSNSPKPDEKKTSIRELLSQLSLQQKKELLKELLGCLKQSNVRMLILEILKNEKIRIMALGILSNYLKKKMGISLMKERNNNGG